MCHNDKTLCGFYTVERSEATETGITAEVSLNAAHPIFQAHFPGYPVTPGVCLVAMADELARVAMAAGMTLREVKSAKFLHVADPMVMPRLSISLAEKRAGEVSANIAGVGNSPVAVAKITLIYSR